MIGLVLSHIFVRPNEEHKFVWVANALKEYKKLDKDFHIVLCGHGVQPPQDIINEVNEVFWEEQIKEDELGRGHPYFCIKGFEMCQTAGCEYTLKNRAYDYIENSKVFNQELVITEQTDLNRQYIGDLFMYGETNYLLNWWKAKDWNYRTNGLTNLFENMPENFKEKAVYISPKNLGWRSYEFNKGYWGENTYEYYGGKGINEINIT